MGVVEEQLSQILSGYWKALCNLLFLFNEEIILKTHIGNWNLKFQFCFSYRAKVYKPSRYSWIYEGNIDKMV